ncbi:MAG: hypothetical protein J1F05_04225 [Muribaculaceae bacterium]|nr:hypothetical protein [Muribaculaceae bacterium]
MISITKQKVVVIGHGSTSRLSLIRAAAELGCDVTVIVMAGYRPLTKQLDTTKPFDCYSNNVSNVLYCYRIDGERLIKLLLDKCAAPQQKVILLPSSDFAAVMIDNNKDILSHHFLFPQIADSSKSVNFWMDKENQKELAREIGLNVPDAHTVDIKGGSYSLPEGIAYPCFTKALLTLVGGKQCFNRCDSPEELCLVLNAIGQKRDARILVEDFKEIETEYAVLGFSDGKNVVIPGIIHLLVQTASHFGIARTGEIMPVDGFEDLLEQFKQYVLRMGFVGIFDIDFYLSDGKYYFGEMNLRFGGSGYAVTKMGVNLPAMMIKYLRGEDYSDMKALVTESATYVNERMCEDDWYRGLITSAQYRQIIDSVDISFVKDDNDVIPLKMFHREHRINRIKKFVKKFVWKKLYSR